MQQQKELTQLPINVKSHLIKYMSNQNRSPPAFSFQELF